MQFICISTCIRYKYQRKSVNQYFFIDFDNLSLIFQFLIKKILMHSFAQKSCSWVRKIDEFNENLQFSNKILYLIIFFKKCIKNNLNSKLPPNLIIVHSFRWEIYLWHQKSTEINELIQKYNIDIFSSKIVFSSKVVSNRTFQRNLLQICFLCTVFYRECEYKP